MYLIDLGPRFHEVVKGQQGVCFPAAEGSSQLDHSIAGASRNHSQNVDQQQPKTSSRISRAKEFGWFSVYPRDIRVVAVDGSEIGRIGRHFELASDNILVRTDHLGPGF